MVDNRIANQTGGDWQVYKYNITSAGMYTLAWIYTKFSEKNATEIMSAEIEYIRVTGMDYSPKQCLNCKKGWSQPGADKCSLCGANHYIEVDNSTNENLCKSCPEGYTSEPGSVGADSCASMRPC